MKQVFYLKKHFNSSEIYLFYIEKITLSQLFFILLGNVMLFAVTYMTKEIRDLNKTSNTIADQSYSERQLFEQAYDRLQSEFEVVLKISAEDTKKKMDKALGRNQTMEMVQ